MFLCMQLWQVQNSTWSLRWRFPKDSLQGKKSEVCQARSFGGYIARLRAGAQYAGHVGAARLKGADGRRHQDLQRPLEATWATGFLRFQGETIYRWVSGPRNKQPRVFWDCLMVDWWWNIWVSCYKLKAHLAEAWFPWSLRAQGQDLCTSPNGKDQDSKYSKCFPQFVACK